MDFDQNFILVDKPKWLTSFDVIRQLRRKLGIRKIGHAGTLDPLATGLLIVGVGEGTKRLREFVGLPKTYDVQVLLGKQTETGDMEGKVAREERIEKVDIERVREVLAGMTGVLTLPVPMYSAVKIKGEPLYKMARRGKIVEPPVKEMKVIRIDLRRHFSKDAGYVLDLEMEVGSGTYVRSIAEEIGRRLGIPATVKELRRTRIGEFGVEDAKQM